MFDKLIYPILLILTGIGFIFEVFYKTFGFIFNLFRFKLPMMIKLKINKITKGNISFMIL